MLGLGGGEIGWAGWGAPSRISCRPLFILVSPMPRAKGLRGGEGEAGPPRTGTRVPLRRLTPMTKEQPQVAGGRSSGKMTTHCFQDQESVLPIPLIWCGELASGN